MLRGEVNGRREEIFDLKRVFWRVSEWKSRVDKALSKGCLRNTVGLLAIYTQNLVGQGKSERKNLGLVFGISLWLLLRD